MPEPKSDSVFGSVITFKDVERAVENTLKEWMPTYLHFMARQGGFSEPFPDIRSFRSADTMEERFIEQQIPALQVMMTTEVDLVTHGVLGTGIFTGTVDVLVQGPTPEDARENAGYYAYAIGLALQHHIGLDGSIPVEGLGWTKGGVPAVGKPDARWLALGSMDLSVAVKGVFEPLAGPVVPTLEPPEEYPTVAEHEVTLEAE